MSSKDTVFCAVHGFSSRVKPQQFEFRSGLDLKVIPTSKLGPNGLSPTVQDLLDFAITVFQIERELSNGPTNPPTRFELEMHLRRPEFWTETVRNLATELLGFMGNASWTVKFSKGKLPEIPVPGRENTQRKRVFLFSGGLDSACGAAHLAEGHSSAQPVSVYTLQKSKQRELANQFGLDEPCQWRRIWTREAGPGHSFLYRSFFFLCVAAATASTWNSTEIIQFENGILATAVPPSPAWMMTKHAHPKMTKLASEFFSELLGGTWRITNPFLLLTKRQCVAHALALGARKIRPVLAQTETCWYHASNKIPGGDKKPRTHCGVCIPCLLRRTALPETDFKFDLRKDGIRNDPKLGQAFRSYYGLLERMYLAKNKFPEFYSALPAAGRDLLAQRLISGNDLLRVFTDFASEFIETYNLPSQ